MKKETLIDNIEKYFENNRFEKLTFIDGAKWQQERSYSEEDLRNAFFSFPDEWICFEDWFEQFKKK